MRIVLSRKGFDTAAGGCPSPIFPDGSMLSLPIPDAGSPIRYRDLKGSLRPAGQLVSRLSRGRVGSADGAHLDPDLAPEAFDRRPGWRALLGQTGSAQGHLRRQGVGTGDLFLFFGLFRPVRRVGPGWVFVHGEPPRHVFWGWLQVGAVHRVDDLDGQSLPWARYHPHFFRGEDPANTLYLSADTVTGLPLVRPAPGAGVFRHYAEHLRLTASDAGSASVWTLPQWFHPRAGVSPLTYHRDPRRWCRTRNGVLLRAAARGQEFVLDAGVFPEALGWAAQVLCGSSGARCG